MVGETISHYHGSGLYIGLRNSLISEGDAV